MPVLGITGGIATGKSTFVRVLAPRLAAEVFDADRAAHELLAGDSAVHEAIRTTFGEAVFGPEGRPERSRLRELVFSDELQRRRLEDILHPVIRARWAALAGQVLRIGGWLCVDIPLLYETDAAANFDRTIVVACSPETQRRRLRELRHLDAATADRMIGAQLDLNLKIQKADHVVWNDSTDTCLDRQAALLAGWLHQHYGSD
jgi:dephospho-CoA kinase